MCSVVLTVRAAGVRWRRCWQVVAEAKAQLADKQEQLQTVAASLAAIEKNLG